MALDATDFTNAMEQRLKYKFGAMALVGGHLAYPLLAVYADRFITDRFALIGDVAVGMRPVTTHGSNLGLLGAETLANQITKASGAGAKKHLLNSSNSADALPCLYTLAPMPLLNSMLMIACPLALLEVLD